MLYHKIDNIFINQFNKYPQIRMNKYFHLFPNEYLTILLNTKPQKHNTNTHKYKDIKSTQEMKAIEIL